MIVFRVDGVPKAQPRARARRSGKHAAVYDPGTAEGWKALVAAAAMPHRPPVPWDGPIQVDIDFFMPRPKALMRSKDSEGLIPCWKRPDRDNLDKAILDILTQIGMWRDDCQVCGGYIRKWYHGKTGRPGAVVKIAQLTV